MVTSGRSPTSASAMGVSSQYVAGGRQQDGKLVLEEYGCFGRLDELSAADSTSWRLPEHVGGADQAFAELQRDNFEDLFVGFDLACDHLLLQAGFAELIPRLGDGGG